ncbi:hypothetical protein LRR81_11590 [Metabacillus sp. GX 13764]|uniref:hypothetical protein n=1 Tax=Metabacillus kandeliae TaxID=2900151 RepID=UPI001E5A4590|nr:hypothetical protein [Metabacillus kandeliae]MCD7034889.1 hypothetical protein [Metabacillus kandeliae]
MTKIPEDVKNMIEKSIYLPMTLTVLNRDISIIEQSPFKLKQPYLHLIEESLKLIQHDLYEVKRQLKKQHISVSKVKSDEAFTLYSFLYQGFEEQHNYFNPRIRNRVSELMEGYLFKASSTKFNNG